MSKKSSFLLLLLGLIGGGLASRLVPSANAGGGWQCYVVDRLPDEAKAADWRGAKNVTDGLNKVSPGSPSGTLLTLQYPTAGAAWAGGGGDVGLICAKE